MSLASVVLGVPGISLIWKTFSIVRGGGFPRAVAKLGESVKNNAFLRPVCCYFWPILAGKGKVTTLQRGRFTNWKLRGKQYICF